MMRHEDIKTTMKHYRRREAESSARLVWNWAQPDESSDHSSDPTQIPVDKTKQSVIGNESGTET